MPSTGSDASRATELILDAVPEAAAQARWALAQLALIEGASAEDLSRIALATSEAVTNAVIHAHAGRGTGRIYITAGLIDGELTLLVGDDGCGWGAAPPSPGLGLGLALIAESCDRFSITSRSTGGTELEMTFKLGSRSRPSGASESRDQLRGSLCSAVRPAVPRFCTST